MFTPFVYTGNIGLFRISQRVARQRSYVTSAVYSSRDKARQSNEQYAEQPGALASGMSFLGGQ